MIAIITLYEPVIDLLIKILLSAITIITFVWGLRKAPKFVASYNEKYLQSVFGYYVNLQTYCIVLKDELDIIKDEQRSNYFGELPLNGVTIKHCKKIRNNVTKLLAFFSSEKGQLPASTDKVKWINKSMEFRQKLSKCMYIGMVDPENKEAFITALNDDLGYFLKTTNNIQITMMGEIYHCQQIKAQT